jgi:hypothetical protein
MAVVKKSEGYTTLPDEMAKKLDKEVSKKASFQEASLRGKAGRKKKPAEEKSNIAKPVYFTEEQEPVITAYCNKTGIPFSSLVKQLLAEKGII